LDELSCDIRAAEFQIKYVARPLEAQRMSLFAQFRLGVLPLRLETGRKQKKFYGKLYEESSKFFKGLWILTKLDFITSYDK